MLDQDLQGHPPSHTKAREMAEQVLQVNGDIQPLSKRWVYNFIHCNPSIASVIGRRIEASCLQGTQLQQLGAFYTHFHSVQTRYNIQQRNVWNMDEMGTALGVCTNNRVLGSSEKQKRGRTYVAGPQNREWVSILETISATGEHIRPCIIFKGKALQTTWFEEDVPDWIYTTSENGWTSNNIAFNWLVHVFIPETQPIEKQPRILLMDGHRSHITVNFLWTCKQNNIHPIFLPAHSSHVLQPLDLSVFSVLKQNYKKQIAELSYFDDAALVKK